MIRKHIIGGVLVMAFLITPVAAAQAATQAELQTQLRNVILVLVERLEAVILERQAALLEAKTEPEVEEEVKEAPEGDEEDEAEEVEEEEDDTSDSSSASQNSRETPDPFSSQFTLRQDGNNNPSDDMGQFDFTFGFSTFGSDFFVNDGVALGDSLAEAQAADAGILISVLDENDRELMPADVDSLSFTINGSTAEQQSSGRYLIPDREAENFTVQVILDPAEEGFFRVQLNAIAFNDNDADPDDFQTVRPATDFETPAHFIGN